MKDVKPIILTGPKNKKDFIVAPCFDPTFGSTVFFRPGPAGSLGKAAATVVTDFMTGL
jgi:hypothetical protein